MKFFDFSNFLESLSKIKKRNDVVEKLKNIFSNMNYDEVPLFIELSLGKFENFSKKDLNIGISTVYESIRNLFENVELIDFSGVEDFGDWVAKVFIKNKKINPSDFNLEDIYDEIKKFKDLKGEGVKKERVERLKSIYNKLSHIEAKYFTKIVIKEIRGGIKEGLFKKAVALYLNLNDKEIDELYLKSGSFRKLFENYKKGEFKIEVLRPIPMMLAEKVESVEEIFNEKDTFSFEYKYDGIRVQIHKDKEKVKIFSRNLNDITESLKNIVDKINENFSHFENLILEGELIGFNDKGEIVTFQDLMSVIFKKEKENLFDLKVFLFDILYLNNEDLTHLPYFKRMEILEKVKGNFERVKYIIPKNLEEGKNFYEKSLSEGFEGIVAKRLNSIYQSGRRGKLWFKLKKVETLDLVILEAFWGYGRRMNWLSDYMLYCLSEDKKSFLPLGKTFKGLTDKEFDEMTKRLLKIKEEDIEGGVRVKPEIVVEVGFEDIQKSNKYESGFALRFARILRIREDKSPFEVNTIKDVEKIYNKLHILWYHKIEMSFVIIFNYIRHLITSKN